MVYIEYLKITDTKAVVVYEHYRPADLSDTSKGLFVESIPDPEYRPGQDSKLFVNPQTGELWYEYEERESTIEELRNQIDELTLMLGDLVLGGGL